MNLEKYIDSFEKFTLIAINKEDMINWIVNIIGFNLLEERTAEAMLTEISGAKKLNNKR